MAEAEWFAAVLHVQNPGRLLAYNCSPSFNWRAHLSDDQIRAFQATWLPRLPLPVRHARRLHPLNPACSSSRAATRGGDAAYVRLQEREFELEDDGYTATRHQREVGAGYFDAGWRRSRAAPSSTLALRARPKRSSSRPRPGRRRALTLTHLRWGPSMTQTPVSWPGVSDDVLEARPPDVPSELAAGIARSTFGVEGEADAALLGERDLPDRCRRRLALPQGSATRQTRLVPLEMQVLDTADPELPIARPRRTVDGWQRGGGAMGVVDHAVQLVALIDGIDLPTGPASPTTRRSIGAAVARLDQALAGFSHPLAHRALLLGRGPAAGAQGQARVRRAYCRPLVERYLEGYPAAVVEKSLGFASVSTIHGDVNAGNVLVEAGTTPARVAGIVDFGDLVRTRTVPPPAIAAAYQSFGSAEPLDPLVEAHSDYPRDQAALRCRASARARSRRGTDGPVAPHLRRKALSCTRTTSTTSSPTPTTASPLSRSSTQHLTRRALASSLAEACGVPGTPARQPAGEPGHWERLVYVLLFLKATTTRSISRRATASGSPRSTGIGSSTPTATCRRSATPIHA